MQRPEPDDQPVTEDELPTGHFPSVAPLSAGLGIGLYLAERIARAHGGVLTLDSTPAGATFVLRLPPGHALAI